MHGTVDRLDHKDNEPELVDGYEAFFCNFSREYNHEYMQTRHHRDSRGNAEYQLRTASRDVTSIHFDSLTE